MNALSSWKDGAVKSAILDFIARVANPGSHDFIPPADRIATFDNDGTLWCEYPMPVQGFFLADRVKVLVDRDPALRTKQPFKAFIEHDHQTLHALGKRALAELFFATHAGMSTAEFRSLARAWLSTSRHPHFERLFTRCVFKPQLELLTLLRERGFKTFIVTGGGIDFVRAFAEEVYGIPADQVIGSSARLQFDVTSDGRASIRKLAELGSFDDREAKPANIALHIGRRPLLAFGNSDGDLAMLRYTKSGDGPRLALLVHHDDTEREFAYDREFHVSPLAEALDKADTYGITLVSMKRDWSAVF